MARGALTFEAPAETYDRHVGRYTSSLARSHVRLLDVHKRDDVLEVGCGTGALTEALAHAVGGTHVCAIDPSTPFVEACRGRVPDADVRVAAAEELPEFDREFAAATSQLVLNFMSNADAGVASMRRAVKAGGVVASVVWDYRAGMRMLRVFWDAALELDRSAPDEGRTMAHCTPAGLRALWLRAGLDRVQTSDLVVEARYEDFEDLGAVPDRDRPVGGVLRVAGRRAPRGAPHARLSAPGRTGWRVRARRARVVRPRHGSRAFALNGRSEIGVTSADYR